MIFHLSFGNNSVFLSLDLHHSCKLSYVFGLNTYLGYRIRIWHTIYVLGKIRVWYARALLDLSQAHYANSVIEKSMHLSVYRRQKSMLGWCLDQENQQSTLQFCLCAEFWCKYKTHLTSQAIVSDIHR